MFDDEKKEVKRRKEERKKEDRNKNENFANFARFKHYKKKSRQEIPIIDVEEYERNKEKDKEKDSERGKDRDKSNDKLADMIVGYGLEEEPSFDSCNGEGIIKDIQYFDAIDEILELMRLNWITDGHIEGMKFAMIMKKQVMNKELVEGGKKVKGKIHEIERLENENIEKYTQFLKLLQDSDEKIERQWTSIGKKANSIEELLGYCGRTNGKINTCITLRIGNLFERAESMGETCGSREEKHFSLCVYKLIEGGIVSMQWVVWVAVEARLWGRWGC